MIFGELYFLRIKNEGILVRCIGSMSGKGNCWDNSVAESFFGRLKQEQLMWTNLSKRYEGQQDTLNFITI